MAAFKSDFMRIVHERGMVHQASEAARLDELLSSGIRTAYIGFDCTADSLHIGSLLQIMMLRWWQKTGHKPVVLMGGGTTKIGDPSGRDETRQLLTDAWRINYETLGNSEPALHTHIIPRYRSEPDDKRGRPAWLGYDWRASRKFDPVADRPFVERMRSWLVG